MNTANEFNTRLGTIGSGNRGDYHATCEPDIFISKSDKTITEQLKAIAKIGIYEEFIECSDGHVDVYDFDNEKNVHGRFNITAGRGR